MVRKPLTFRNHCFSPFRFTMFWNVLGISDDRLHQHGLSVCYKTKNFSHFQIIVVAVVVVVVAVVVVVVV